MSSLTNDFFSCKITVIAEEIAIVVVGKGYITVVMMGARSMTQSLEQVIESVKLLMLRLAKVQSSLIATFTLNETVLESIWSRGSKANNMCGRELVARN